MRTAREILDEHGIRLRSLAEGRNLYSTCPRCSEYRKPHNRRKQCLSVLIDREGVQFCCHHCGWHGGKFFDGNAREGLKPRASSRNYQDLQRSSRAGWR